MIRSSIIFICVLGTLAGVMAMLRDGVSVLVLICTIITFCSGTYLSSYEGGWRRVMEIFFISLGVLMFGVLIGMFVARMLG